MCKCTLYFFFQIIVNGNLGPWSAWLETHAGGGEGARPLTGIEGCVLEPTAAELTALHAGAAYFDIRASDNDTAVLRTRLPQVGLRASLFLLPVKVDIHLIYIPL